MKIVLQILFGNIAKRGQQQLIKLRQWNRMNDISINQTFGLVK